MLFTFVACHHHHHFCRCSTKQLNNLAFILFSLNAYTLIPYILSIVMMMMMAQLDHCGIIIIVISHYHHRKKPEEYQFFSFFLLCQVRQFDCFFTSKILNWLLLYYNYLSTQTIMHLVHKYKKRFAKFTGVHCTAHVLNSLCHTAVIVQQEQ